jgi:hypothetical protein
VGSSGALREPTAAAGVKPAAAHRRQSVRQTKRRILFDDMECSSVFGGSRV